MHVALLNEFIVIIVQLYFCLKPLYFYIAVALLAGLFMREISSAQTNVLGGWYIVNLNYHLNEKLSLYSEVQARGQHVADDFFYRELKAGISYALADKNALFIGLETIKLILTRAILKSQLP